MKDTKHIRRDWDFHLAARDMRQGWDLGVPCGGGGGGGGVGEVKKNWRVSDLHEWHMHRHNFLGPHPLGPWEGAKRSNIIKSQLLSQFQRF